MASVGAAESIGECKAECHVRGDVVGLSDVGHDSTLRQPWKGRPAQEPPEGEAVCIHLHRAVLERASRGSCNGGKGRRGLKGAKP